MSVPIQDIPLFPTSHTVLTIPSLIRKVAAVMSSNEIRTGSSQSSSEGLSDLVAVGPDWPWAASLSELTEVSSVVTLNRSLCQQKVGRMKLVRSDNSKSGLTGSLGYPGDERASHPANLFSYQTLCF